MKLTKKVKAYIEITRPLNILITVAVVFGAAIISYRGVFNFGDVVLSALAAAFTAAAGNIINDYFDIGTDFLNRPLRPLPSK
ncbi:MAG: UbiA family prenyltransferase, partial [Ignavibacteriaceae bacterium]|nr:UbiA family prenyltransferase [Ignavibacteriaceae bacterium]